MHQLALAVFVLALQQTPAQQQQPVLVVNGDAQILTAPDEATVRLGIVRQSANARMAQEQVNTAAQQILAAITKAGVPQNQIQTARLVLTPVYAPRSPETRDAPRIVAYNAVNTISVRLDNLALIGAVIDAGLGAGANQLEGVQFGLRNELPARQEAIRKAVEEARGKAEVMADALRVSIVSVIEAMEGGISIVPVGEAPSPRFAALAADASVGTPVSPGQIQVSTSVTVRYRIAPKP